VAQDCPIPTERLRALRDQLVKRFSLDELRNLAFSLGVNWDSLLGETIDTKATALLEYLNHRVRIPEVIDRLHVERPGVVWALDDLTEPAEPPYHGLEFYREEDTPLFFDRARLTALFFPFRLSRQRLAQILKPRLLGAMVVGVGLDEVHEGHNVLLKPVAKLFVGNASLRVEGLLRLRQREHVRVDPRAQMLQGHAQ
jgi:hypothetical protein